MECILGSAGIGKEEMKCFSVVNNILFLLSCFMLSLILQACETRCLMLGPDYSIYIIYIYMLCGFMFNLLAVWGFCLLISGVGLQFMFYIFFCIHVSLLCISQRQVFFVPAAKKFCGQTQYFYYLMLNKEKLGMWAYSKIFGITM